MQAISANAAQSELQLGTTAQGDEEIELAFGEKEFVEGQCQYKRSRRFHIDPIYSESEQQYQPLIIDLDHLNFDSTNMTGVFKIKPNRSKNITKLKKSAKKMNSKIFQKSTHLIKQEQLIWDEILRWELPEECMKINREHKQDYYDGLYDTLLACFEGKSKVKMLFLSGGKETAKKTILFDIIAEIKQQFKGINEYLLDFQDAIGNNIPKKMRIFSSFLQNNISAFEKSSNDEIVSQKYKNKLIKNVLIIDNYISFLMTFKEWSQHRKLKELLRHNASNLIIFIDTKIYKREIQAIADQGSYLHIQNVENSKNFFLNSLMAAVNNYPFKNAQWEIMRPLANFFSTKMEQNGKLRLSIIRKFIYFLERKGTQAQQEAKKVNRQILESFMQRFIDRTIRIDLRKLTIHEKAVLTGCYLILKQSIEILISIQKLFKMYTWICQSMSLKTKQWKDFTEDVLFQLSIYKLIKVQKWKKMTNEVGINLTTDFDLIKYSLHNQIGFSKFFQS